MIRTIFGFSIILLLATNIVMAEPKLYPRAKVSFEDFKGLISKVESHREKRLIALDTFLKMSKQPKTIILDARSDFRFDRVHIKGARHLSFTDFTQENLSRVIPNFDTNILIYCNNNFEGNQIDFASKIAKPKIAPNNSLALQLAAQAKPIMLALNIPTYVNLFGYGYQNIYELDELVKVDDPRIELEGTTVKKP